MPGFHDHALPARPIAIRRFRTAEDVAVALAERIVDRIRAAPNLVIGLPTGRTPLELYREIVRLVFERRVDCSHVTTFNLDEFIGVGPDEPESYRAYMERHLFGPIGLAPTQVNFLDGMAADTEAECERYEKAIRRAGGIDLLVLGIGRNGHIGFNEPGPVLRARCHRVELRPETRRAVAEYFDGELERVPKEALSMGMGTILQARAIVLIATGRVKAQCVAEMIEGPVTTSLPASFLQLHGQVDLMVDVGAAARLTDC